MIYVRVAIWCAGLVTALYLLFGCSHGASDLARYQDAVQNCILAGGRPVLGPGRTIICAEE